MILYFPDSQLFNEAQFFRDLRRVIHAVEDGRHKLHLVDVDGFQASTYWKEEVPGSFRMELVELCRRLVDDMAILNRTEDLASSPSSPHVEIVPEPRSPSGACLWSLKPDQAAKWVADPLRILLENMDDFVLLAAAARVYRETWLLDAVERRWCVPVGCGGKDEVHKELKRTAALARVFVFIDSDREVDGAPLRKPQSEMETLCRERKPPIPCYFTRAREMENYIPERIIEGAGATTKQDHARKGYMVWSATSLSERRHLGLKLVFGTQWIKAHFQGLRDRPDLSADDLDGCAGTELRDILRALLEHL